MFSLREYRELKARWTIVGWHFDLLQYLVWKFFVQKGGV